MKVISTNLGATQTVNWRGKPIQTGIFKSPVDAPIWLGEEDVRGDAVVDRKYHGGTYKACYLYSADHYPFWQKRYPTLDFAHGMFGENLTVEGLDETQMVIGSKYRIGSTVVQVSEPRQPCFKLGIRFEDQSVLKHFINSTFSGVYLKVLESGEVRVGDELTLVKEVVEGVTIAEVFELIYAKVARAGLMEKVLHNDYLRDALRVDLVSKHGVGLAKAMQVDKLK